MCDVTFIVLYSVDDITFSIICLFKIFCIKPHSTTVDSMKKSQIWSQIYVRLIVNTLTTVSRTVQVESFILAVFVGVHDNEKGSYLRCLSKEPKGCSPLGLYRVGRGLRPVFVQE